MPPHSEQIVSRICGALFRGSLEQQMCNLLVAGSNPAPCMTFSVIARDASPFTETPMPQVNRHLISPDPHLDFCCSPANSFVLPMFSMTSDSWRC
ncbi:hypothetical protein EYR26_01945 [Xanthomonas oryzae]|nr:hypothetical protein EYR26_01945 [Xanthomonas oryzae]